MIRSLIACAVLAHGGLVVAQPGAAPANPFNQPARGTAAMRAPLRDPIAQAEESALQRHFEKMLDMKLDMELQLDFARIDKGSENPEIDQVQKRLNILAKRLQDTKSQIEVKFKARQEELLKQQQQLQQRRGEERNNPNARPDARSDGRSDGRQLQNIPLKWIAATDAARALLTFADKNQNKIQNLTIQSDERTNSLVIYGSENDLNAAKEIIKGLDKSPSGEKPPAKPK